jgi:hypothetical protein
VSDGPRIAGDHGDLGNAFLPQLCDGLAGLRAYFVLEGERPEYLGVATAVVSRANPCVCVRIRASTTVGTSTGTHARIMEGATAFLVESDQV